MATAKSRRRVEFGDFQTPAALAERVCGLLRREGEQPASLLEPTCGEGSFLAAALRAFPELLRARAQEIDPRHIAAARANLRGVLTSTLVDVVQESFFETDWQRALRGFEEPLLVIGNPPWVTSSALGVLGSGNVPEKRNAQHWSGMEALTGKSNFDISEWMLCRLFDALNGRQATLAMLVKTAVARKALAYAWRQGMQVGRARIHAIDTRTHFGVAVSACLLVCRFRAGEVEPECAVFADLESEAPDGAFGYREGRLVADLSGYERWKHRRGPSGYQWRSGIKHDCCGVMEFARTPDGWRNGLGENVEVEDEFLYPMLKTSQVASEAAVIPDRWMLVTQRSVTDPTAAIEERAPRTWQYLANHAEALDRRGSSIYRKRPRFAIFGVGEYAFSPWKVAISGLYKKLSFKVIGPAFGKPVVLDDTSYFLACGSEAEAKRAAASLNSEASKGLLRSLIFWDAKRPITVEILRQVAIERTEDPAVVMD